MLIMKPAKASDINEANEMLASGQEKVELCFSLSSDEFFSFTDYWCERGAKIIKKENFIVKMNSSPHIKNPG